MSQTSISSFFGKRKRLGLDDIKANAKKLQLDRDYIDSKKINQVEKKIDSSSDNSNDAPPDKSQGKPKRKVQADIRSALNKARDDAKNEAHASPVKFQLLGSLSPTKKVQVQKTGHDVNSRKDIIEKTPVKEAQQGTSHNALSKKLDFEDPLSTDELIKSANALVNKMKESQMKIREKKNDAGTSKQKELSLKDIKDKLKQSSRLNELKKSINKINEQAAELMELDKKKKEAILPKLKKFDCIEIDVPTSPRKGALYSPVKPEKSPLKPAYQRYAHLTESTSKLPLPFGFQKLYELFEASDTVCSMMMNRKEDVTFNKLKSAVQEMTRKNFTTRHLGQIATVLPGAYTFQQEKVRNFGSTSKADRYELIIKPSIPKSNDSNQSGSFVIYEGDKVSLTPKLLKTRKEAFYRALLERTKDCHEEFLKSLDPPLEFDRNELKRWHPNFMVDHVPDIIPTELPQPPNSERPASAKDVLERAKEFLSSNARLQKALEAAAEESKAAEPVSPVVSEEIKQKVDAKLKDPLKGVSKSLLERIRAKQAAKAIEVMKMTPEQEKESLKYTRLPDFARIVRTLFVDEQKAVLSWDTVIDKVQYSYNRNLSKGEIEAHLKLLVQHLPDWLSIVTIRESKFLKMNRNSQVSVVMEKLQKIVKEKKM